jgi:hypothetical protein
MLDSSVNLKVENEVFKSNIIELSDLDYVKNLTFKIYHSKILYIWKYHLKCFSFDLKQ